MEKMHKGALPTIVIMILGTVVALMNQSALNTALQSIMLDLAISTSTAQWLSTAFALVTGIVVPVTAFLIRRFSTKQVFTAAMGLLTLGTLICSISPGFGWLLTGRIVQAVGAGTMLPLLQTLVFILVPAAKRGFYMGMIGLSVSFAPAIGPVFSGWLVENHSWRMLFYILGPASLLILGAGSVIVKNVTKPEKIKLDTLSVLLSTLGFGGILYGFSVSGNKGWDSAETLVSLAVGVASLGLFVWRQLTKDKPLLELRVFKNATYTSGTLISMILMIVMLSSQLLLPIFMQSMLGYSSLKAGLMLLPGAIANGLMSPISGKLFDKLGGKLIISIGLAITVITSIMFAQLTETTSYVYLIVVYSIRMIGISMCLMPSVTSSMNSLMPALIPHGIPVNTTMRTIAGSIGTALLVTIMTHSAGGAAGVHGMIHGMNVASIVTAGAAAAGLVLALMMKRKQPVVVLKAVQTKA